MDKIIENLKRENICFKCHDLLDSDSKIYDQHVKTCKGGDTEVITTKFYTKKEMTYQAGLQRKKSFVIGTTWGNIERPATR
jgi:hypothetical protein|uniref:Uncharacterized protein n=1 Tax=viral metagenome TaxID=1070528 RepID=A0A6C0C2I1_9ZZZZ